MTTLAHALLARRTLLRNVGRFSAGPHRRARPAPRPLLPRAAEMMAVRAAETFAADIERAIADELAPVLAEHLPAEPPVLVRLDEGPRRVLWRRARRRRPSIAESLDDVFERATAAVGRVLAAARIAPAFERVAAAVGSHVLQELRRQFRAQVGIDPISSDAGLVAAREAFVRANVERIAGLADRRLEDVRRLVLEAASRGLRVEELAGQLEEQAAMGGRRAAFVARDQVLTVNAQMTRLRMQNAGVREYVWSTSRDERVRPTHADLEGTRQRFDQPPVISEDGRTGHPGDDYLCRCTATPVLEGLFS